LCIIWYQHASAAGVLDIAGDVARVVVLVEVGNQHFGACPGKRDGDGTADAAIAAGNDRPFAGEFSRAAVTVFTAVGHGIHSCLHAGNRLLLRRKAHCDFPFRDLLDGTGL
jgi:hypothetical protein